MKLTPGKPAKLRLTFETSQTVEDLIQASSLLKYSSNPAIKNVYFNRDLTKIKALEAFEQRAKRRSSGGTHAKEAINMNLPAGTDGV